MTTGIEGGAYEGPLPADDRLYNPLLTIDPARFGLRPLPLGVLFGAFGIETRSAAETLASSYECAKRNLAPLMVKAAVDMLPHLRAAVAADERTRVVFAGRDSFSLGYVTAVIDPDFSRKYCHSLYLTRAIVDAAVAALEETGSDFRHIDAYRKQAPGPARSSAEEELRRYLTLSGLDLDAPGGRVLVVDTGYKGSIQEMLAALYPHLDFEGHYVFHAGSQDDPHPGSKRGYVVDVPAGPGTDGRALRGPVPTEPELIFTHHEAIVAVEELLQGSHLSPSRLDPAGRPRTVRARRNDDAHEGLNPVRIRAEYHDPVLREAVLMFNVLAVSHVAAEVAARVNPNDEQWYHRAVEEEWYRELASGALRLRSRLRAWVSQSPTEDPDSDSSTGVDVDAVLTGMLDSFVHRADRRSVNRLAAALARSGARAAQQDWAWRIFDLNRSEDGKEQFAANLEADTESLATALPVVPGAVVAPALVIREHAVGVLRACAPALSYAEADRVCRVLGDDPATLKIAGDTIAASAGMTADRYVRAFRERVAERLAEGVRVVASLPLLVAQDLAQP